MAELPPGFRFYPTEEELIGFYLRSKLDGRDSCIERVIPVADICAVDPWQLPEVYSRACAGGEPWFYFCQRQEREARGGRPSRTTPSGYWKAAGTPGWVYTADGRPIGSKKTMVFYRGRAPGGMKTKYKMNEYRALDDADVTAPPPPGHALQTRSEFSLCRLYTRGCPRQFDRRPSAAMAGRGIKNDAQAASCSTAALVNVEVTGNKRKRSPQNDDDTSSSDGDDGRGHCRQQLLAHEGTADGLVDDGTDDYWTEFLDSFPTFDAGNTYP